MTTQDWKEEVLNGFLRGLRENVFVSSVNSVTTREELLRPEVNDLEAIIEISGQWDREDLKNLLVATAERNVIERVRGAIKVMLAYELDESFEDLLRKKDLLAFLDSLTNDSSKE